MRCQSILIWVASIITFLCHIAYAWERDVYSDAENSKLAEVVAIGHLKDNSFEIIPNTPNTNQGRSWEQRTILVIGSLLKGKNLKKEIPITVHYGLNLVVGGYMNDYRGFIDQRSPDLSSKDVIQIFDGAFLTTGAATDDLRTDHIWFLRHDATSRNSVDTIEFLGIWNPQDVQPLARRKDFQKLIDKQAEQDAAANP